MLRAEKEGITPGAADRARLRGAHARLRRVSGRRSTTTTPRNSPENQAFCEDIYAQLKAKDLIARALGRAVLRSGEADVPAGPLHQGRVPELPLQGPVRRLLRGVRHDLQPDRSDRALLGGLGRQAGAQGLRALFLQAERRSAARASSRSGRRASSATSIRSARSGATRCRNGSQPGLQDWDISRDPPYFGFAIPGTRRREVLLRLAGRAGRLLRQLPQLLRPDEGAGHRDRRRRVPAPGPRHRDGPLHRQGHPLFPRAVLAGDAAVRRLPHADQGVRPRLSDRGRAEDVQVARHLHHRRELSGARA